MSRSPVATMGYNNKPLAGTWFGDQSKDNILKFWLYEGWLLEDGSIDDGSNDSRPIGFTHFQPCFDP